MHVTSRWPFIGSEIIPFGPQTHQLLGTGGVIQQPTDRQILPHPSNILNIKSREDTDLCNDREAELQLWTLLRNKNLPIPFTIYLFTTSTTVSPTQSQHLLFNSMSLYTWHIFWNLPSYNSLSADRTTSVKTRHWWCFSTTALSCPDFPTIQG